MLWIITAVIKRFLYIIFNLLPVTLSHGWVLEVLDKRHGSLELLDAMFDRIAYLPFLILNIQIARHHEQKLQIQKYVNFEFGWICTLVIDQFQIPSSKIVE